MVSNGFKSRVPSYIMKQFKAGVLATLPVVSGVLPFGAVMGATFAEASLPVHQAFFMNTALYSGAAQLATIDLMKLNTATLVVVGTGLIINVRFLLYSAALSPYLAGAKPWVKLFCAFTLTDQSYASMSAKSDTFTTNKDAVEFYVGTAVAMLWFWHLSTVVGYVFGNIAPKALNLDYAVPLSFVALLIPTLKTRAHRLIAVTSSVLSLALYQMPLRSGLITTALISIALAWTYIQKKKRA